VGTDCISSTTFPVLALTRAGKGFMLIMGISPIKATLIAIYNLWPMDERSGFTCQEAMEPDRQAVAADFSAEDLAAE